MGNADKRASTISTASTNKKAKGFRQFLTESYFAYQFIRWFIGLLIVGVIFFAAAVVLIFTIDKIVPDEIIAYDSSTSENLVNNFNADDRITFTYKTNNYSSDPTNPGTGSSFQAYVVQSNSNRSLSSDNTLWNRSLSYTSPNPSGDGSDATLESINANYFASIQDQLSSGLEPKLLVSKYLAAISSFSPNGMRGWLSTFYTSWVPALLAGERFANALSGNITSSGSTLADMMATMFKVGINNYGLALIADEVDMLAVSVSSNSFYSLGGLIATIFVNQIPGFKYSQEAAVNITTWLSNNFSTNEPTWNDASADAVQFLKRSVAIPSELNWTEMEFRNAFISNNTGTSSYDINGFDNSGADKIFLLSYFLDFNGVNAKCLNRKSSDTRINWICDTYLPRLFSDPFLRAYGYRKIDTSVSPLNYGINFWCSKSIAGINETNLSNAKVKPSRNEILLFPTSLFTNITSDSSFGVDLLSVTATDLTKSPSLTYDFVTLVPSKLSVEISDCTAAYSVLSNSSYFDSTATKPTVGASDSTALQSYADFFNRIRNGFVGTLWNQGKLGTLPNLNYTLSSLEIAVLLTVNATTTKDLTFNNVTFVPITQNRNKIISNSSSLAVAALASSKFFDPMSTVYVRGAANFFSPFSNWTVSVVNNTANRLGIRVANINTFSTWLQSRFYNANDGLVQFANSSLVSCTVAPNCSAVHYFYDLTSKQDTLQPFEYKYAKNQTQYYNIPGAFSASSAELTLADARILFNELSTKTYSELLTNPSTALSSYLYWLSASFTIPASFSTQYSAPVVTTTGFSFLLGQTDSNSDVGTRGWESTIVNSRKSKNFKVTTMTGLAPNGTVIAEYFGRQAQVEDNIVPGYILPTNITLLGGTTSASDYESIPVRDIYRIGDVGKTFTTGTIRAMDLLSSRVPLLYACGPSQFTHPNVENSATIETIRCNLSSAALPTFTGVPNNVIPITRVNDQFVVPCGFKTTNTSLKYLFGEITSSTERDVAASNFVEFFVESGVVVQYQSCYQFGFKLSPMFYPISMPSLYNLATQLNSSSSSEIEFFFVTHERAGSYLMSADQFTSRADSISLKSTSSRIAFYACIALGSIFTAASIPFLVFYFLRKKELKKMEEEAAAASVHNFFGDYGLPAMVTVRN